MAHRRKKGSTVVSSQLSTHESNVKCVELQRSRHGFGFTLSGQMPSILTQVKGGAHLSGLRNGDYLMTVNDIDVLHMSHEDIVELIKRSVGSLRLRCLENDSNFSSNSDDSDIESSVLQHSINPVPQTHRHRNRYGNHLRNRKTLFNNKCNSNENLSSNMMSSEYNGVDSNHLNAANHNSHNHFHHHHNSRPQSKISSRYRPISGFISKSNEPILDLLLEQKLSKIKSNLSESDSNNSNKTNSLNTNTNNNNNNNNNNNSYERNSKKSSNESNGDSELHQNRDQNIEVMINPSMDTLLNNDSMSSETSAEEVHSRALLRAIVGYLGTIETPVDSHIDSNLIKNCIRRIRVENKLQTIILLAIYQESILLVNINGQTIAQFSAENLKSCGICTDDRKYFAIITSMNSDSQSYSCHVFATSASVHQTHYKTAQNFGIKCTLDPVTSHCLEFPENSDSILRVIVGLYRHKVGCAPSALANVSIVNSGANSSDSGINEYIRMDTIGAQNNSYNTERLEAQLNPTNVRQTVNKYLKLKNEINASRMIHNTIGDQLTTNDIEINDCQTLSESLDKTIVSSVEHNNKFNDFVTSGSLQASEETHSLSSNDKINHKSVCSKSWVTPATLSKENLELNNEITSGYDCETKSSMSLEGVAPMSDTFSASASVVSERPIDVGWVGGWAQDFEKLLSDNVGLNAFAEFLKKEFSHENLQFWMSCEEYKKLSDTTQLKIEAKNIFERHLCSGAPEPVNVDGRVRLLVELGLENPGQQLFSSAEKQIYNLMKFDCYQRFLKSSIYKECVSLELQGKPLPYENEVQIKSEENFKTSQLNTIKPKKRSFIPWHRIKSSKAEKQQLKQLNAKQTYIRKPKDETIKNRPHSSYDLTSNSSYSANRSDMTGSQSSIASSEPIGKQNTILSKSRDSINKSNNNQMNGHHCHDDNCHLFRVILPDHSQAVVPLIEGQKIGPTIEKLLQKRSLNYSAFDAFITGSDKGLDLNMDVSTLGCNEIRVEQRVLFQIDFPNREVIGIKARTSKTCGEVFGPLLSKYGYKLEHIVLQIANSSETVTDDMPIIRLDNQRIIVCIKDDLEEWGWDCMSSRIPVAVDKKRVATQDSKPIQIFNDSIFDKSDRSDQSLSDSPEKENRFPEPVDNISAALKLIRDVEQKDSRLNDCNISFSDDTKSEAFFRELMLCSQHKPINSESISLTPKLNTTQKTCAKSVTTNQTSLSVKPIPRTTIKSLYNSNSGVNNEIDLNECELSPIERLNSRPNLINDIDLDVTLKSIQLYNMRNDMSLTPTIIPYPSPLTTDNIVDISAANFTPPSPIQTMPMTNKQHKQLALTSPSNPPPLPPKAGQRERGPPPRPPVARHSMNTHLISVSNQNKKSFVRNIDQIIDSNISFV